MVYLMKRIRNRFLLPYEVLFFMRPLRTVATAFLTVVFLFAVVQVSAQTYFRTDAGILYVPVLAAAPATTSAGAMYINSVDKKLYWYDGSSWATICCQSTLSVSTLGPMTLSPTSATNGSSYSGTLTVGYTGGSVGIPYSSASVSSAGVTGLTAILPAGTLSSASGSLVYNVSGVPASTGTATFAVSFGGQSGTASLTVNGSMADNTTAVDLTSPTGRVWMDRNLGATQAATNSTDYLAYGSLYQWVRVSVLHQKITWTSGTTGTPVNGTTTTLSASTTAPNSLFITSSGVTYDWLSTQQANGNLWWSGTAVGANNPCPTGYHVPTYTEWNAEYSAGITNAATAFSRLKLPAAGYRSNSIGALDNTGSYGYYWSSTVSGARAYSLYFNSGSAGMSNNGRANGFSVRCLKD